MWITLLKSYWKEILIAVVIAGAVWYVQGLRITVAQQETKIAQLEITNQVLADNNHTLKTSIASTNASLSELSKGAKATTEAFSLLRSSVGKQLSGLNGTLENILKEKTPVTCEDTIRYLIDAVPGYKQ